MFPGQDGSAAGRAGGGGRIGVPKQDPPFGERIDVRGLVGARFIDVVTLQILPAQIVDVDQHHVRFGGPLVGRGRDGGQQEEDNEQRKSVHGFFLSVDLCQGFFRQAE